MDRNFRFDFRHVLNTSYRTGDVLSIRKNATLPRKIVCLNYPNLSTRFEENPAAHTPKDFLIFNQNFALILTND